MNRTTERVRKHRQHLRELGLKPMQIWVPDTRTTNFREECKRQCRLIAKNEKNNNEMKQLADEAIVEISSWSDWTD